MIMEQYFDEPIIERNGFEFSLTELEDYYSWFENERPSVDELSDRELIAYGLWTIKVYEDNA